MLNEKKGSIKKKKSNAFRAQRTEVSKNFWIVIDK